MAFRNSECIVLNSKTLINEVKHIRFLNYFSNEYIYGDEGREYIYEDRGGYENVGMKMVMVFH
ncbi:hypothetical protein [Methanobrevibacter sp.]|uniref:hypothetical protein n=1 Tax=Methanobrevibacter sp. TaxID=66852 RepID=UPI00386BB86F